MRRRIGVLAIALVAVGACQALEYGYTQTLPAFLELSDTDTVLFLVPDTVQHAVPFDVSVRTYGENGCVSKGPLDVQTPYDTVKVLNPYEIRRTGSGIACTQELRMFMHSTTLTFALPGQVEVHVVGRDRVGVSMLRAKLVVVQ